MDQMIKEWTLFLDQCLALRLQAELFDTTATELYRRSPLPGRTLASILLRPRSNAAISVDPRIYVYCERLLALQKIDASDVLLSAFSYSRDCPQRTGGDATVSKSDGKSWRNPPELEEVIFNRLHYAFSPAGKRPVSTSEGSRTIAAVSKWMVAMVTSHNNDSMIQAMAGIQQHSQQQYINVRESLGMLVGALIDNEQILTLLNREDGKEARKALSQALSSFIPLLSHNSLALANKLEVAQKQHDFYDKSLANVNGATDENPGLDVAVLQLDAVMDLPIHNTRAGLFIFLNSLLVARPLTDDFTIINFLHSRFKVDAQNMATDLITAAFDILANSMYRNESNQTMFCLKSFLVNKVPILLLQLSSTLFSMPAELSITQALSHIDPGAFPAFSQSLDDIMSGSNSLADVRQDFLNACALHGLIATNTVERLLGEAPMQRPPETKYIAKDLLSQFKDNFETVHIFIDELGALDGNAGAIVGALTEFISNLCDTQMTMYLKTLCNLLSKRPQALDVMLQFTSPANILRPLCQFLDEWRYEETQGEYQPVYDEFGAILVLILAFVHRYDMTWHDLGTSHESFVAQLLDRGHHSILPEELTDEQGRHLGSWLRGLYDSDKEALGNDVFASCRPQDFYLIVPTLFSQTVKACSAGVLSLETVKGGLEYLHNTFLLPSLVGGLTWMTSHALKQTHEDLDVLMQVFHKLIRSAPTAGDAQAMHSTILCIVSSRLEKCFRTLKRRHPSRTDIEPLLQTIKTNLDYERSVYPPMTELENWTRASPHMIEAALRHTVQQLSQWVSAGALQLLPPSYSHRQIYVSLKLLGASKTIRAIAEEIKVQTDAGNGAAALDIGVSIICAPTIENSALPLDMTASAYPRTHMNLREMLKAEFDNAASLVATDPLLAETIVRLHRRVEAQLTAVSQVSLTTGQMDLPNVGIVDVQGQNAELDKALNDAAAATIAAAGGDMQPDQQALQRSLDQHLSLAASGGGLDLSGMGVGGAGTDGMGTDLGPLPDLDLEGLGDVGMGMDLGENEDDWDLDFNGM